VLSWKDRRNGVHYDIFVQRINANGTPAWAANGVAVCTAANAQDEPYIIDDGAGGAIVTWQDARSGSDWDVYARAVNFLGTPVWTANGVAVAVVPINHQLGPRIISDGALGAILVWADFRNGGIDADIYAQRLSPAGAAMWTANGKAFCMAQSDQLRPTIVPDGTGGAIMAWSDSRGADLDIRAQRVTALGVPLWMNDGLLLCGASANQDNAQAVADGVGGAVVMWADAPLDDIYAQRVDATGLTYWNTNGVPVGTPPFDQHPEASVPDGTGGIICSWTDNRSGDYNLYAQRIEPRHGYWGRPEPDISSVADVPNDQGGFVALNWLASERDALQYQEISHYSIWRAVDVVAASSVSAAADASLGRRVALSDVGPNFNEPAYRVERMHAVDYFWEFVANQSATYAPAYSYLTPTRADANGGDPATHYFQVVAHTHVPNTYFPSAPESGASVDNLAPAAPLTLTAVRTTGSNAKLDWSPSGIAEPDLHEYWIYRAESSGFPTDPAYFYMATADTFATDSAADPSLSFYYKVVAVDIHDNSSGDSNEAMIGATATDVGDDSPSIRSLTVLSNAPNPFSGTTEMRIGLPSESDVTLEVYDVAGRRVAVRTLDRVSAGWQRLTFDGRDDEGKPLPSGVYFARVNAAGGSATRKLVVYH
ncbi:MAG TPA: T9SS type A sorting domain-containing protein, partial [Candidatus Krumholzibacteria bacterium]|nr:T9SS type A sorting domain-containing protein [Candidatus Krumholzibacteria bacterium]